MPTPLNLRNVSFGNQYVAPNFSAATLRQQYPNLTESQIQTLVEAQNPGRFTSRSVEPNAQMMSPANPTFRDQIQSFSGDAFGNDPRGRWRQQTFQNTVDLLDPGLQLLSEAKAAFGRGATLSGVGNFGLGMAGVLPATKVGRRFAKKQQPASEFIDRQDVLANPESFGGPKGGALTTYAREVGNPAVRRRDAHRLSALEQVGPAQFGEGGLKLGELGTEGSVTPVQRTIIKPEDLQGRVILPVFGDTSNIRELTHVGGVPLSNPVQAQGGPNFSALYDGWASNRVAAQGLYNNAINAARHSNEMPVGIYGSMGPESILFTNATVEAMVGQLDAIGIPQSVKRDFDRSVRNTKVTKNGKTTQPFKNFVGLDSPEVLDQLLGKNNFIGQSGDLRKAVVKEMSKADRRMQGFPVYSDVYNAISMRELRDSQVGDSGFSIFGINTEAGLQPETWHETYDTRIPGEHIGGFQAPVGIQTVMPKSWKSFEGMPNRSGQLLTEAQKIGKFPRKGTFFEVADQEWVDTNSLAIERAQPYSVDVPQSYRFPQEDTPFGKGRTFRATHEQVPGEVTGHLAGITRATPEERVAYSSQADWLTPSGQDMLYQAQGLPVEQSVFGRGAFEASPNVIEFNPMTIGQPVTADMSRVEATEAARAYIDAQAAGAAHRIRPHTASEPAERVDLSIDVPGEDMTQDQFEQLTNLAGQNDFFAIDSGDRVVLNSYPWNEDRPAAMLEDSAFGRSEMSDLQRQVREIVPGANLRREKLDVVYETYEELYKEVAAGTKDPGAVTRRMFERVDARPDVRDAIEPGLKAKAGDNLRRDAQYSNQYPVNPAITRALTIFAEGGFDALRKALDSKTVLPAVAATILAPSFLDSDQEI